MKRKKLTKTEKRDLRDNTSLGISLASLGIGVASLLVALNRKSDRDSDILYSENKGRIIRRCVHTNFFRPFSDCPHRSEHNAGASFPSPRIQTDYPRFSPDP